MIGPDLMNTVTNSGPEAARKAATRHLFHV